MRTYHAPEISPGLYYVGVKDWNLTMFDVLTPLRRGTSYNSYLVKGEKTALIDSTAPGFEAEWEGKVEQVLDLSSVDYLVMNHAEPDHAGAIPYFLSRNSKAKLVASEKGAQMAKTYFGVSTSRLHVVKEGDSIDLGGKTMRFLDAQWLHWPEVIFTYVPENQFLSSCDFFGAHTADGLYDDEVDRLFPLLKSYWGEILMPYRVFGRKAMEKIAKLDLKMIGPSHGPVYRNLKPLMDAYRGWTNGETLEKAVLVYASMWAHTETLVSAFAEVLKQEGVRVAVYNMAHADDGELAADLVDSRAVVLASPAVLGGLHPKALYAAVLIKALKPPVKYAAVLSSYGWSRNVAKQATEALSALNVEMVGEIEVQGPAVDHTFDEITTLARKLAAKIKTP